MLEKRQYNTLNILILKVLLIPNKHIFYSAKDYRRENESTSVLIPSNQRNTLHINMADQNAAESLSLNNTMNDTAANKTVSGRAAATPEGLMIAYASLIVMALLPIWVGSFKSVLFSKKQRVCF